MYSYNDIGMVKESAAAMVQDFEESLARLAQEMAAGLLSTCQFMLLVQDAHNVACEGLGLKLTSARFDQKDGWCWAPARPVDWKAVRREGKKALDILLKLA